MIRVLKHSRRQIRDHERHGTHDLIGRFIRELKSTEETPTTTSMNCRGCDRISLDWNNGIQKARTINIQVKNFTSIHTSSVESVL